MKGYIEEGNPNAVFKCSNRKKNIFLIGDSIREGYCEKVKKELSDFAEVFYPSENCRHSYYVISSMRGWSGLFDNRSKVDLVQFNFGHWDAAHWCGYDEPLTDASAYAKNIKMTVWLIKKFFTNAKIVFATTTPLNPNGMQGNNPRTREEVNALNDIARSLAEECGYTVNDLYEFTKDWTEDCFKDYCHFNNEPNEILGKRVAEYLKNILL